MEYSMPAVKIFACTQSTELASKIAQEYGIELGEIIFSHFSDGEIIRLWKDGDNTYHLKGIWVDDNYILLTGNNLNPRTWRLDAENSLFIHDPQHQLRPQVLKELEHIRQHTTALKHYSELEEMDQYPAPVQKLLKKFARIKADKLVKMIL